MNFFDVSAHDLMDARPGLQLVERLLDGDQFTPYVYGMTSDASILEAAKAAIVDDAGQDQADPELSSIAIAVRFSGDSIYALAGSGLLLQHEEFAYFAPGEGARTLSFQWAGVRPRVNLKEFSTLALADSDMYLAEFLKQNAKEPEVTQGTIARTPEQPAVKQSSQRPRRMNAIDAFLNS